MSSMLFNDDFGGFHMDSEFVKSTLICDVLLSNPDLLHDPAALDSGYDHSQSPGIDPTLEFCVPDDGEGLECGPGGAAAGTPLDMGEHCAESPHCGPAMGPGPLSAPLQSFPSVDVGYLRRRCKAEAAMRSPAASSPGDDSETHAAAMASGRRRAESDPMPGLRAAMRGDQRKRRMEEQGQRAVTEMSEEERLEKNRQSARDCRLRKKRYIENLERRISEYEKREIVLTSTIARLEEQLASALSAKMSGSM